MSANIYLALSGQRAGPFTIEQVREHCRTGAANRETLFWQPGQVDWQPLERLPAAFEAPAPAAATPTPPPTAMPPTGLAPAGYMMPPARPNASAAVASVICGGLGLFGFALPLLGLALPIAAVVLGHIGRGQVRRSAGRLDGSGAAIAGLIMGYLSIAGGLIVLFFALVIFYDMGQRVDYSSHRWEPTTPPTFNTPSDDTPAASASPDDSPGS